MIFFTHLYKLSSHTQLHVYEGWIFIILSNIFGEKLDDDDANTQWDTFF